MRFELARVWRSNGLRSRVILPTWDRRYHQELRGLFRIFNDAQYRFYRSNAGPPAESDAPFATSASLPHEPADLYADGTWYLSCSYFDGVIDSGFLPLGPNGETYLRLDISGGVVIGSPPQGPGGWSAIRQGGSGTRVTAYYLEAGSLRAAQWALTYDLTGGVPGTPPAVAPTETIVMMGGGGMETLIHDLPAATGPAVQVRLQTRRLDGAVWRYSEGSTIIVVDMTAKAAAAPGAAGSWPGPVPQEI